MSDLAAHLPPTLTRVVAAAETGPLPACALSARGASTPSGLTCLFRFAVIGSSGFVWDTATTYAARPFIGLLPAAMLAFVVAATLNWLANRLWTFRDRAHERSPLRQWALYMAANSLGFLLNRGTFAILVLASATCRAHPVIGLAAGALAGLAANFSLSQRVVFRGGTPAR